MNAEAINIEAIRREAITLEAKVIALNGDQADAVDPAVRVAWESLVQNCLDSGFMQSLAWADFKIRQGLSAVLFLIIEDGVIKAGCIGYFSARHLGASLLVSPEGPVMPWHDAAATERYMRRLDRSVKAFCAAEKLSAWRVEPRLSAPLPGILKNFSAAPIELVPKETLYLDIAPAEDAILAQMHHKARYNINLAQRRGVAVFEENSALGLQSLYKVLGEASRRDGFFLEPQSFFEDLIGQLGGNTAGGATDKSLSRGTECKIILAEHEEEIIGGLILLVCGTRATYLYGGVGNLKRNLMAGYLLQWRAILLARAMGASVYDFYGYIEEQDPSHLYCNFSQFKKKFGGTAMRFCGAREQFYMDTLADAVVRAFNEINFDGNDMYVEAARQSDNTLMMIKGD